MQGEIPAASVSALFARMKGIIWGRRWAWKGGSDPLA